MFSVKNQVNAFKKFNFRFNNVLDLVQRISPVYELKTV